MKEAMKYNRAMVVCAMIMVVISFVGMLIGQENLRTFVAYVLFLITNIHIGMLKASLDMKV